jgi:predicted lipoprotein
VKKLCAVAALALLTGCEGISVADAYVKADRLTYDAIAPGYRAYVEADEKLDAASKQSRMRLLDTWKLRIEANTKAK